MRDAGVNSGQENLTAAFQTQGLAALPIETESLGLLPVEQAAPTDGAAPTELMLPEEAEAPPSGDPDKRKRRREHWEQDQEIKRRWELQRRLADISTDVDLLTREVRLCSYLALSLEAYEGAFRYNFN